LIEERGIMFRANYLIDPKGVLRQIMMDDLPIGGSIDEALHLVLAFSFTPSVLLSIREVDMLTYRQDDQGGTQ
jgi:alkyl hydroperoxide reductase subunit AhpC